MGESAAGPVGSDEAEGLATAALMGDVVEQNLACSQASCSAKKGVTSLSIERFRSSRSGKVSGITKQMRARIAGLLPYTLCTWTASNTAAHAQAPVGVSRIVTHTRARRLSTAQAPAINYI